MLIAISGMPAVWSAEALAANASAARKKVVILGDSITAGYGVNPNEAYPAILQSKIDAAGLPFEIVNAGVSGDTTAGGLRRVDWALSRGADILIVALGGNDGLRGVPPSQTEANLIGIVNKAKAKIPGLTVLMAGMQMPPSMGADFTAKFAAVFPAAASKTGARLIPFLLEGVGGIPELNQGDMIHPNPAGHRKVADVVWGVLKPVLVEHEERSKATAASKPAASSS